MLKPWIPVAVAVVAIITVSVLQGVFVERNDLLFPWGGHNRAPDRDIYVKRVESIPMNFGDGVGKDTERELDEKVKEVAGIEGRISRTYRHTKTHEEVSVEIVCGLPQHLSEHTPDRCFVANGYTMPKDDQPYTVTMINGQSAEFRRARFRKETHQGTSRLHIFWSWRTDDTKWFGGTVHSSRFEFASKPALYKIYVIDGNPKPKQPAAESPFVSFIEEVLPQIDAYLSGDFDPKEKSGEEEETDDAQTDD